MDPLRILADYLPTTLETISSADTPVFGAGEPIQAIQGIQIPQEERTQGATRKQDMLSEVIGEKGNLDLIVMYLRWSAGNVSTGPLQITELPERIGYTGTGTSQGGEDDGAHTHEFTGTVSIDGTTLTLAFTLPPLTGSTGSGEGGHDHGTVTTTVGYPSTEYYPTVSTVGGEETAGGAPTPEPQHTHAFSFMLEVANAQHIHYATTTLADEGFHNHTFTTNEEPITDLSVTVSGGEGLAVTITSGSSDGAHNHTVHIPAVTLEPPIDLGTVVTAVTLPTLTPTNEIFLMVFRNGRYKGKFAIGTVIPFDPAEPLVTKAIGVVDMAGFGMA